MIEQNLSKVSTQSLKKELSQRESKERQEKQKQEQKQRDFWLKHIDILIGLIPRHCRTSCSDTNLNNRWRRCARCILLAMKKENYWDEEYIVDIHISKKEID